jgi:hypothetical protein
VRILLFILVLFIFVDASHSQVIDGVEIVKPRIITGDWDSVTKKCPIAVEFTIAKGWHMYWLNPGDAGSPPEVKWALPMDWQIGKLQFPVPVHEIEDGFETFAYYDKLVLYSEITSPSSPQPNDLIEASIGWMVCKDICVAGKRLIKWPFDMTSERYEWPKLPLVPTLEEAGYNWAVSPDAALTGLGGVIQFIELNDGTSLIPATDFYPYITEGLLASTDVSQGAIKITTSVNGNFTIDKDLNGLVMIDDKAYWLKAP